MKFYEIDIYFITYLTVRYTVPFAVEEKSGTISVVDEVNKFDRPIYNFEAIATNDKSLSLSTNVTIHVAESDANAMR